MYTLLFCWPFSNADCTGFDYFFSVRYPLVSIWHLYGHTLWNLREVCNHHSEHQVYRHFSQSYVIVALDDSTAQEGFKTATLRSYCLEMNGNQWLPVTAGKINKTTISMVSCDVKVRWFVVKKKTKNHSCSWAPKQTVKLSFGSQDACTRKPDLSSNFKLFFFVCGWIKQPEKLSFSQAVTTSWERKEKHRD